MEQKQVEDLSALYKWIAAREDEQLKDFAAEVGDDFEDERDEWLDSFWNLGEGGDVRRQVVEKHLPVLSDKIKAALGVECETEEGSDIDIAMLSIAFDDVYNFDFYLADKAINEWLADSKLTQICTPQIFWSIVRGTLYLEIAVDWRD